MLIGIFLVYEKFQCFRAEIALPLMWQWNEYVHVVAMYR